MDEPRITIHSGGPLTTTSKGLVRHWSVRSPGKTTMGEGLSNNSLRAYLQHVIDLYISTSKSAQTTFDGVEISRIGTILTGRTASTLDLGVSRKAPLPIIMSTSILRHMLMPSLLRASTPATKTAVRSALLRPSTYTTPIRSFSSTPFQNATLNQVLRVSSPHVTLGPLHTLYMQAPLYISANKLSAHSSGMP